MQSARKSFAVRQARKTLIRAGVNEDTADRFLDNLRREVEAGGLQTAELQRSFCEAQMRELGMLADMTSNLAKEATADLIKGILLTIIGSAPYDLLTAKTSTPPARDAATQSKTDEIRWRVHIHWTGHRHSGSPSIERLCRSAFEANERLFGDTSLLTSQGASILGNYLDSQGRHREAERLLLLAFEIANREAGPNDKYTGAALVNLGSNKDERGHHKEAEPLLCKGLQILSDSLGRDDVATAGAEFDLGVNLALQGRPREAIPYLEHAAKLANGAGPPELTALIQAAISGGGERQHVRDQERSAIRVRSP
jgi:tetratricopeptide (TPR) repeat protein